MSEETKSYTITCDYKKCTYETEIWTTEISTGKTVTLHAIAQWWWGTFIIKLTPKEKEEILQKTHIILNDYEGLEYEEGGDTCYIDEELQDKELYTESEMEEITKLMYCSPIEKNDDDEESEDDNEYEFNTDILHQNNWTLNDTIYSFESGCELEERPLIE